MIMSLKENAENGAIAKPSFECSAAKRDTKLDRHLNSFRKRTRRNENNFDSMESTNDPASIKAGKHSNQLRSLLQKPQLIASEKAVPRCFESNHEHYAFQLSHRT